MDRPGPATRTSEISFEVFASINVRVMDDRCREHGSLVSAHMVSQACCSL